MESVRKTIEVEIGVISYEFEAEIFHSVKVEPGDYFHPSFSECEIERTEIISEVKAWNNDTETDYIVEDSNEIKMIEEWVDWTSELEKTF